MNDPITNQGQSEGESEAAEGRGPWLDTEENLKAFVAEIQEHAGWTIDLQWPDCITWSHPEDGYVNATPDYDRVRGVVPVDYQDQEGIVLGCTSFPLPAAPQHPTIAERAAAYQRLMAPHLEKASALSRSNRNKVWTIETVPYRTNDPAGGMYLHLDGTGATDVRAIYVSFAIANEGDLRDAIARHGIAAFAAIAETACERIRLLELLRSGG